MVSEKLKTFFGKVKDRLKLEDIGKFAGKEAVGAIPVIGSVIKDAINEFLPDEKEELIKELKELSENQFREISEKAEFSVVYLKDIRKFALYSLEELRADHEQIEELIRSLIEELKPPIRIPTIQSALKKGDTTKGDFFKKEPEWIDFKEGFIVERKQVNELIKKLENNGIQLVLGEPASGKSVILKNIGFKLAKKGHSVYLIELKKWSADRVESYFKEALRIDDERTIIIVDDAHLQLSKCEGLVRDFRYTKLSTKLIIGLREVKGLKGGRKETSEFENLAQTKISAIDATEKIICTFLKKKHGIIDEHRIKDVSEDLEKYKDDLWNLSWTLETYDKDTDTVSNEEVYSAISKCITNIKVSVEKTINGQDILLPLSVFYRFEIPIEKRFLTKILEIDEGYIDDLIGISEIRKIDETGKRPMLSLYHSSLASLYFKTYQMTDLFPALGEDIKEKITEQSKYDDWERGLLYLYLKSEPKNVLDVLFSLCEYTFDEKGGLTLLGELIEDKEIGDSIKKSFEKEGDIWKIQSCVLFIAGVSEEVALKLFDSVLPKIEQMDIGDIVMFMSDFVEGRHFKGVIPVIDTLVSKIEEEEDIEIIKRLVGPIVAPGDIGEAMDVVEVSEEVKLKLIDSVFSKIEKEEDIQKIGWIVRDIGEWFVDNEVISEFVNRIIKIDILSSKIEKEEDVEKIRSCMEDIADASEEVAQKIVRHSRKASILMQDSEQEL